MLNDQTLVALEEGQTHISAPISCSSLALLWDSAGKGGHHQSHCKPLFFITDPASGVVSLAQKMDEHGLQWASPAPRGIVRLLTPKAPP